MSYTISHYNTTTSQTITVPDNSYNEVDTSLRFIGRNYPGYGKVINENFLYLLENFSSLTEPTQPTPGQLWHNSANDVLNYRSADNSTWTALISFNNAYTIPSYPEEFNASSAAYVPISDVGVTYKISKSNFLSDVPVPPIGSVVVWGGSISNLPLGWLICNGAYVYIARYPSLYTAIGLTNGTPPTVDTFLLPNLTTPGGGLSWIIRVE